MCSVSQQMTSSATHTQYREACAYLTCPDHDGASVRRASRVSNLTITAHSSAALLMASVPCQPRPRPSGIQGWEGLTRRQAQQPGGHGPRLCSAIRGLGSHASCCVSGPPACAGRCSNLVVMAHSSAALFAAPLAAAKAGALVFLGSYFFPSPDYHASLYEWSR